MAGFILAIDQGTTSTRAMVFDAALRAIARAQRELTQHYPSPGHVEHDLDEIWQATLATCRSALTEAGVEPASVAAIGIANQRETIAIWDRRTGEPLHRAIVWQDRRTSETCRELRNAGYNTTIATKTGLLLDPYFSATKLAWLLDNVPGARAKAEAGELAAGTIDTYLIWRLTGGNAHLTDATNASRTMLFDIAACRWDPELCALFDIPLSVLPEVRDCTADFGVTERSLLGGQIRIAGVAGDQQAATIGQACFAPGMMKATYGTGCFALLNTGSDRVSSTHNLLTTIAYRLDGKTTYALEGSIFVAGAAVQWLRDGLGMISTAAEVNALAGAADPDQEVCLVPAFVGLGAPYWDSECRGAIYGLTRNTGAAEIARSALESVCYQTRDLLEAMHQDWPGYEQQGDHRTVLRVDGGMVASDWTMQRLADILDADVDRPGTLETTAIGAAYLAGLGAGLCPRPDEFARQWQRQRRFSPDMPAAIRDRKYAFWKECVCRTLTARP